MTLPAGPVGITHHLPPHHLERSLRADVRTGLMAVPKSMSPKWFYDQRGSALFEQITELPEYYPTRAEREVLARYAAEIAESCPADTLIELGSGSSRKTPLLLGALMKTGPLQRYISVDVSDSALTAAAAELTVLFPGLLVQAVAADFETQLHVLPRNGMRMVAFLGGTIGNFEPGQRAVFLRNIRELLGPGGGSLLLGTDLVKAESILVPAYDDGAGVTADFNKNLLRVLNRDLGADFDVDAFEHIAVWNARQEWIEMRLRATRPMNINLPGAGLMVSFDKGEEILTEISAKFRPAGITAELEDAGFEVSGQWTDSQDRFAMTLAKAV